MSPEGSTPGLSAQYVRSILQVIYQETAHVERWNNTLRQRLARFVRMTLSFSRSEVMHEACLLLFLHRYNQERAILLK